jgi:Protein of unknown function (DUF3037)
MMEQKSRYSYVVLRYIHDVLTSEFVNVGVVMYVPAQGRMLSRTRHTISRLRGVFPDLERTAFTSMMSNVSRGLRRLAKRKLKTPLFNSAEVITALVREAVPADDSSLQWSPLGAGITANVNETFEQLYDRFVSRYDTISTHRRTDDEIWRPVLLKLEERHLASQLQEKVIVGSLDDVTFKHAWKNGHWNVYEPVSFDLADSDGIKRKAREWLGHLAAVVGDGGVEAFKPHFLVGAPTDTKLNKAYEAAKAILRRAPNDPEIFEEGQVDDLVAKIEDEIRAHERDAPY